MKKLLKKLGNLATAMLFVVVFADFCLADTVKGKVAKVENEGRFITVKPDDGKEIKIKISGRTALDGISDRSEFKAGQTVSADLEGGEAIKVKVTK